MPNLLRLFDRLEPPLPAELEPAYRRQYLRADIFQVRAFWVLLVVLKLILLGFLLFSTERGTYYYLWLADDVIVSALLFGLAWGVGRVSGPAAFDRYVGVVMAALLLDNLMFALTGSPTDYTQFTFDILLIACCYLVTPLPLAYRLALAGSVSTLAVLVLFLFRAPAPLYSGSLLSLMIGGNALGLVISTRVNFYRRQQFHANAETLDLNAQLAVLAETDSLTRVYNRRKFVELGADEVARLKRYGQPCSLALIDVDFFKQVNDRFGHAVGDEVLQAVAQALVGGKRVVDQVGRLGGEEFGLLLPTTSLPAAVLVVDRIRQRLAAAPLAVNAPSAVTVTFSAGVTQLDPGDASLDEALRRADQLLYQAKQAGRNRVEAQLSPAPA